MGFELGLGFGLDACSVKDFIDCSANSVSSGISSPKSVAVGGAG